MTAYEVPLRFVSGSDTYTVIDPRGTSGGGGTGTGYVSIIDFGGVGDDAADNTAAFNTAVAALDSAGGGTLFFPAGIYRFTGATSAVPGGITLLGTGIGWNAPWDTNAGGDPKRASVLKAAATMDRLVQLGSNSAISSPAGGAGASMRALSVFGGGFVNSVVRTAGRRNYLFDCEVVGGKLQAVHLAGQNSHVIGGVVGGQNRGDGITVQAIDSKVYDVQVREAGPGDALINVKSNNCMIERTHLYHGSGSLAAINIDAYGGADRWGIQIIGNTIEECGAPEIRLRTPDDMTGGINGIVIVGNHGYTRTNGVPFIDVVGAGRSHGVSVVGNHAQADPSNGSATYSAFARFAAGLSLERWHVTGNTGRGVDNLFSGTVSAGVAHSGNSFAASLDGTGIQRSDADGQATFTGDGSQTSFVIPHGMGRAVRVATVTAGSAAASGPFYVTSDATNIPVTFAAAPAAAASVVLNWRTQS